MKQPNDPNSAQVPASPSNWDTRNRPVPANPQIYQPSRQVDSTDARRPTALRPAPADYVDPYLLETGYFANMVEHDQLLATAETRIQRREDVEHTPKHRRSPRSVK